MRPILKIVNNYSIHVIHVDHCTVSITILDVARQLQQNLQQMYGKIFNFRALQLRNCTRQILTKNG